jgi:hypothetical protein
MILTNFVNSKCVLKLLQKYLYKVNLEFLSLLINEIKSKLQYWFGEPYNGVPWR